MPKGSMQGRIQVVEQSRCRTHRQQTTTIAQMQSQQSIHSPSPRGRGLGIRQGCRDRTPKGFMQGRIQVVEQSRCRTHRQQTTTIAETQSPQSVLIVIENLLYFYKYRLFLQTESDRVFLSDLFYTPSKSHSGVYSKVALSFSCV